MMGFLQITVALSTLALASAFPRTPGRTRSQQQISEYFPDPRYPDQMTNPSFMTAKCLSEGVFPHPYNCAWFYRCHDLTGEGFFHTSYFICAPGTEFDDDLDQCITKSGTCSNEIDIYFCKTLPSSCRTCNGRPAVQVLCEFQECYSGGRDAGIQRICAPGQLYDGQNCVEVSDCPLAVSSPPGECHPTAKWTDQTSGCSMNTGCRAGKNYQEFLCSSYYDCPEGAKMLRSCPEGSL